MLFCRGTTRNEICLSAARTLMDPFKRIYFIMNIHMFEYYLLSISETSSTTSSGSKRESQLQPASSSLTKLSSIRTYLKTRTSVETLLLDTLGQTQDRSRCPEPILHILFNTNQLVMSATAGEWVSRTASRRRENFDLMELFLQVSSTSKITKRLSNLSLQIREKEKVAISI